MTGSRGPISKTATNQRKRGNPGKRRIKDVIAGDKPDARKSRKTKDKISSVKTEAVIKHHDTQKKIEAALSGKTQPPEKPKPPFNALTSPPVEPDWLTTSGREYWATMAPVLVEAGILKFIHADVFGMLCNAMGEYVRCQRILADEGTTFKSPNGHYIQRPEVTIARAAFKEAKQLFPLFGLTPAALARLNVTPPQQPGQGSPEESDAERREKEEVLNGG